MIKVNTNNIFRGVIFGLGIILVLVALAIVEIKVAGQNKPIETPYNQNYNNSQPKYQNAVNIIINSGDRNENFYFTITQDKSTVFDVLKEMSKEKNFGLEYNYNYPKLGVLIDSIAGIKSGTDGKYWQYYINGTLGDLAADKKEVKAGDKVEWRFEKVPEF